MNKKQRALRKEIHDALDIRLDALDAVIKDRTGDNIRYSMYCEHKLTDAIENYHNQLRSDE